MLFVILWKTVNVKWWTVRLHHEIHFIHQVEGIYKHIRTNDAETLQNNSWTCLDKWNKRIILLYVLHIWIYSCTIFPGVFLPYFGCEVTGQEMQLKACRLENSTHRLCLSYIHIITVLMHSQHLLPMSHSAQGFISPSTCFCLHPKGMKVCSSSVSWREKLVNLYSGGIL